MMNDTERSWETLLHAILLFVVVVFGLTFLFSGSLSESFDNVCNAPQIARQKAIRVGGHITDTVTAPFTKGVSKGLKL